MFPAHVNPFGHHLMTDIHDLWAAGSKWTARSRIDKRWNFAACRQVFPRAESALRIGNRCKQ